MYTVYKLTLPNQKSYIGQTSQKTYKRWSGGAGYAKNKELYDDIVKYGWINIEKEVLAEVEDSKEAHIKEREYILKFRTNEPGFGYNRHINDSTVGIKSGYEKKLGNVRCVETDEEFKSGAEVARKYGVTRQAVDYAIKKGTACAGYHWERMIP